MLPKDCEIKGPNKAFFETLPNTPECRLLYKTTFLATPTNECHEKQKPDTHTEKWQARVQESKKRISKEWKKQERKIEAQTL